MQQIGGSQQMVTPQPAVQQSDVGLQPVNDPFEGLADEDLVTAKSLKQIVQGIQKAVQAPDISKTLEPINATLARIQVQLQDPNFETTIRTYLPEMITANPGLQQMITQSHNPLLSALAMAKLSPKYQQDQAAQNGNDDNQQQEKEQASNPLDVLQKIIENSTKPGNPAQMGGSGAVAGLDRFAQMDPMSKEFGEEINKVLNRI